ncbi:hypothetical protein RIF29_13985 [Crotalaria pallida]|uniref:Wall-associated receptor kinase C-terminal domain-containing protein n=1 Tax=Crotalaria pallida TaxID=3830 RepID=A0AAN9FG23_CROPI
MIIGICTHVISIAFCDLNKSPLRDDFVNAWSNHLLIQSFRSDEKNLTLFYGCPGTNDLPSMIGRVNCFPNGTSNEYFYAQFGARALPLLCRSSVVVPVSLSLENINDFTNIQGALNYGFSVTGIAGVEECEECKKSDGACGYDLSSNQTTCYCRDQFLDTVTKTCSSSPNAKAPPQSQVPPVQGMYAMPGSSACFK